jgi:hypothetical protein
MLGLLSLLCILASSAAAQASTFDPLTGRLSVSDAAYGFGFDHVGGGANAVLLQALDWYGSLSDPATRIVHDPNGLEGGAAFELGAELMQATLDLSAIHSSFVGRRVEMRLWVQPRGTMAAVKLNYVAGDWFAYQYGFDYEAAFPLGYGLSFMPTGRATDDGWQELSTGPIDYAAGGVLPPAFVSMADVQFDGMYSDPSVGYDFNVRVGIDAFEILDLGPAAVPTSTCSLATEASLCGPQGLCLYGRCVDSALAIGAKPLAAILDDYVERRIFEIEAFEAIRLRLQNPGAFSSAMRASKTVPEKRFWTQLALAYETLVDGHSLPPLAAYPFPPASGYCVYISEADLLPNGGLAPMVYTTKRRYAPAALLHPGDVLVSIDGLPVADWRALAERLFYYGGDPSAREVLQTPELVRAAAYTGASMQFARCGKTTPCTDAEVETVTVDYAQLFGQSIWANQTVNEWYSDEVCDFRFSHPVNSPNVGEYEFAGSTTDRGVRVVEFNGFPSLQGGSAWMSTMNTALQGAPPLLMLDQRRGDGGSPDSLIALSALLLGPSDTLSTESFPLFEPYFDNALLAALRQCGDSCGGYYTWTVSGGSAPAAQNAKLAVLFGIDVSANDFFSRGLQYRSAETRFFGAAPSYGAFGVSHSLASYIGEVTGGAYQGSDSIFWTNTAPTSVANLAFESGQGVPVHETVYQKQSDAVLGRDTLYEAAMSWLLP